MKRGVLIIFIVSLAMNAGFLGMAAYSVLGRAAEAPEEPVLEVPDAPPAPQPPGPAPDGCPWTERRIRHLSHRLELDRGQALLLRERLSELAAMAVPTAQELRRARWELRRMLASPDVDRAEIRAKIQEVSRLQNRMDSLATEGMLRELEVLRAEQRAQYKTAFRGRRHGHRECGPHGP
ncbi:MAG: periplasmic heavy metal sensor [Candidatus Eisenbacteria bacterium]|nr:periplasmic heavy metal sensor [Candidatus Eisenbacteria bacterium]